MAQTMTQHQTLADVLRWRAEHQPNKWAYTFLTYGKEADSEADEICITYGELHQQAQGIAHQLLALNATGERALLLYPSGLDFIAAFFGCLYAGVVAVPTYPPRPRTAMQFLNIVNDAQASVLLTTGEILGQSKLFGGVPHVQHEIATDQPVSSDIDLIIDNTSVPINSDSIAFLQYTSGSTSAPKGVMVSHGNLMHNLQPMEAVCKLTSESIACSWLPLYHDLGLITKVLGSVYTGTPCVLMSPWSFIQQPIRWLHAISHYRVTHCIAPNFAYDLCVHKTTLEQREGLDLSCWQHIFNGAEPIQPTTLQQFITTFESYGIRKDAFAPCYGLAESTVIVTQSRSEDLPIIFYADPEQLKQNHAIPAAASVTIPTTEGQGKAIVGCGQAWGGQTILIVDPDTHMRCSEEQIGEIWIQGTSVAQGYWQNPEATAETFQARLADTDGGADEGAFLRTGDLGFMHGEELFVTGRLKNMIIIRGQNYYAQDIELVARQAHPILRFSLLAAFAIDSSVDSKTRATSIDPLSHERLVIVCELPNQPPLEAGVEEVTAAVRQAVSQAYALSVYAVALIEPRQMPKTTSGKIQHYLCREQFLSGTLPEVGRSIIEQSMVEQSMVEQSMVEQETEQPIDAASTFTPNQADGYLRKLLADLPPEDRREQLHTHIRRELAGVLGLHSKSPITPDASLFDLGVSSLMAVELKDRLESYLDVSLPSTLVFDYPTLDGLEDYLLTDVLALGPETVTQASVNTEEQNQTEISLSAHELREFIAKRHQTLSSP
ncbi:MAG: AMP-binding protein [Chloroflexota bacterium]